MFVDEDVQDDSLIDLHLDTIDFTLPINFLTISLLLTELTATLSSEYI